MSAGTLTLHRFNGVEVFNVSDARIRYFVYEGNVIVDFEVDTEKEPIQTQQGMEGTGGWPNGAWQLSLPSFDPNDLVGKTFVIPQGYDEVAEEYLTNFYYFEHENIDENEIVFIAREGDQYRVQITGTTMDVNYYNGSKPATKIVVLASFSLAQSEEPIDPVG